MHVRLEHNLWDYVYFIAYFRFLEEHRVSNITAVEKYVLDKMNNFDNSWFPCFSTGSLEDSTLLPVVSKISDVETLVKSEISAVKAEVKAEILASEQSTKSDSASIMAKMSQIDDLIRRNNQ
jgi:hypothetical protein